MPEIIKLLETVPVSFSSNAPEQRLRSCLLDIILRLQTNDTLKPKATEILHLLMDLLRTDNEENGILCMKILTSLHRAYKTHLLEQVQPFLDLVIEIYKNIPQVVNELFNSPGASGSGTSNTASSASNNSNSTGANGTTGSNNNIVTTPVGSFQSPKPALSPMASAGDLTIELTASRPLQKSLYSFKVLTECPIIIVLLYSTHKHLVNESLPVFIPHIIEMLSLQAQPQQAAHEAAAAKGLIFTSISPLIKNRTAYGELIVAQVKTMSFLAYALRGFSSALKKYHNMIPDFVVRLLQDCPCELSSARKELLVATRHILSTDFRTVFIPKVDILLNEKVLIGEGLTVHETLRPLAYSTMADLVHHVRGELTSDQIWKTVRVYCRNMQDNTLATSFQIMSAKLLLNLVERIMKLPDGSEGRQIMVLILNAFVERFSSLNREYTHIMKKYKESLIVKENELEDKISDDKKKSNTGDTTDTKDSMDIDSKPQDRDSKPQDLDLQEVLSYGIIKIHQETGSNDLKDARYIFKNLMNFLKTVMFGLKSCNPPPLHSDFNAHQWQESARMFNYEQITIFRRLFREGISGHLFFASPKDTLLHPDDTKPGLDLTGPSLPVVSSKDEKDLMEAFATVFIHIDPASFNEIVEEELPFLYNAMFENSALLHIPQFFLASEATSANFSGLLITFLKSKLSELGDGDNIKSNILIRLFKLSFMAVNLFPATNEIVMLPHLKDLIINSLELSTKAKDPLVYFHLLRTLFRSIGGGRFELLYKEVLPLLQVLLESLNKLLSTARKPQERDIYVELCLTVPVRLSVLVPHLSYLMRPLVTALNGSQELVSQGLRTLELCVDNLTAEYFDPIIEPVIGEVFDALWKHLRPLPYFHQHSHTTLRVLGKLGGRNRRFLVPPSDLTVQSPLNQNTSIMLSLNNVPDKKPLNITPAIKYALEILEDPKQTKHYRIQAYEYITGILLLFIESSSLPEDFETHIKACLDVIKGDFPEVDEKLPDGKDKRLSKRRLQNELVARLLEAIFYSVSIEEIKDRAMKLIRNLCEHFTLLELGEFTLEKRKAVRPFELNENEGIPYIDPKVILSVIVYALSHYNENVKEAGCEAIHYIFESCVTVFGSTNEIHRFPMFRSIFGKLSHTCFEVEYYRKAGACLGIKTLLQDLGLPILWIAPRHIEFIRTMFFVLKDTSNDYPCSVRDNASELCYYVLRECNKDISPEQIAGKQFQQLTGFLTYGLGNANPVVRETSKKSLQILAEVSAQELHEIIKPVSAPLLTSIFGKPLRALPFPMQIGHIDAISFCLGLKDTFLEFNEELMRLLSEALALVDAEDESLTSAHRAFEYKTSEQLVQLRIVCIQLLSLALTTSDYLATQQAQTRAKIIAVFFKTLYSRSSKVVEAAHLGLKNVLAQNVKLPRDLLQNGLRPILMNLSDHKRLTVSGLEGLARLLELLTFYFKVEIGKKLLDHLKAWAEPSQLHANSTKNLNSQQNIKIIAAILNVFHLLPPTAYVFMNDLIHTLFYLESHLRRQHNSSFRLPIAKFLDRYPQQAFAYFLPKLSDRTYGRFYASILENTNCANLRKHTRENLEEMRQTVMSLEGKEDKCIAICNFIYIMDALNGDDETWIVEHKPILDDICSSVAYLIQVSTSGSLTNPLYLQVDQSLQDLQLLFVKYFKAKTDDYETLFLLIATLSKNSVPIHAEITSFLFNEVACSSDVPKRRAYLSYSIDYASNKANVLDTRTFVVRYIINTILIVESHRNGDLCKLLEKCTGSAKNTNSWLDMVHSKIWRPSGPDIEDQIGTMDHFRFELLQMSAILIKTSPNLVADARKDIIKFGWVYIKLEDIISKQAAYVLITYFIAAYDTLSKIVVQIYVALLKTHQNEAKFLVRQALDLLAPVIIKRVNSPLWAKWPRRVLSEDGHNVSQVINIYQFIVRHAELFYDYRDHFVSNIIAAMPKLTFLSNSSSENHQLAVDLAELILKWEIMYKDKEASAGLSSGTKRKASEMEGEENTVREQSSSTPAMESIQQAYSIPFAQREACITYLIRFVCISSQKVSDNPLGGRVIRTLDQLLSEEHWPEVVVKLTFFERSLIHNDISSSPNGLAICLNALEVIAVTLCRKKASWIVDNLHHLERLLEKSIRSDNLECQISLSKLMAIIFKAINTEVSLDEDEDIPESIQTFTQMIVGSVQELLSTANGIPAGVTLACSLAEYRSSAIDFVLTPLMKSFGKLCKDHVSNVNGSSSHANGSEDQNNDSNTEVDGKRIVELLDKIVNVTALRISYLGDQRRVFLSLLAQLIERSSDKNLCHTIVNIVRNWVFSKTDLFPTTKEKAAILTKMMTFEIRGNTELAKEFYSIVVDIYKDSSLCKSELSLRMEHAFLVGTRMGNIHSRKELMKILSDSLDSSIVKRLHYIIADQNWEYIGESQWINQALQLLYKGISDQPLELSSVEFTFAPLTKLASALPKSSLESVSSDTPEDLKTYVKRRSSFLADITPTVDQLFSPLVELQYVSPDLTHQMWINFFPQVYSGFTGRERTDIIRALIILLSKDFHNRQIDKRPNVIQSLLEGVSNCEQLPPHLVKYLGKSFNAWYPAIKIMENIESDPHSDSVKVSESNLDALAEMYASLQEDDMFYGSWRRRSKYTETNSGLSYEQIGMWGRAMQLYETAQIKARSGALPYGESEYSLWEDHWILCAEKLQQWDVLTELAKHEGFTDLLLECGWRVADWTADKDPLEQSIKTVMDVPTPRRQVFETFLCLQGYAQKSETLQELSKYCDEGIQLALRKWFSLPNNHITGAHIPLLHTFQQYVEFMEASQVYTSLQTTTAQNLDTKSQELKGVLQAWRERLPNLWDDINIWGDLVTWRQHAFGVINKVYLPLIPSLQTNGNNSNSNSTNSYAYRGYHEIAWIINRFAHVARKHNMPEVCISQLTKIYTLPNIEIQEAFLKLREQAKCHYQNSNEMNTGLDVISNTNLVYFVAQQKAEFFTLKGMFLAKLNVLEDANQAFATAVQIDLYLPKAWAEWGYFNDKRYQEHPDDLLYASNAISCYLQAAGLYKSGKTRKLLGRILWLISIDDSTGSIAQAFDGYRGEVPVWYWITFIPQLLTSLSHKEARLARHVLIKIAKSYPQALHFHLRTTKEDFAVIQRQAMQAAQAVRPQGPVNQPTSQGTPVNQTPNQQPSGAQQVNQSASTPGTGPQASPNPANLSNRQPWEHVEEIVSILKTAYPLLTLSLETLADQVYHRFKSPADEDAYRLIVALLNDGVQYMGRLVYPKEDAKLPPATETNITRFAESVLPKHIKSAFENDFVHEKPNLETYVLKLRKWRDRFEAKLDARPNKVNLEALSPHLSEFHYQKFEEIEVPGQYFQLKDNNLHFIKIDRFMPTVDVVRGFGVCYRRITIRGHDGSMHPFAIQYPAARHCRREERVSQLFKILNGVISRRKECRKRKIQFTLPIAVPFNPHIRIIQDDSKFISMQAIYEDYCRRIGQSRDAPLDFSTQRLRAAFDPKLPKPDIAAIKMEILTAIQATLIPNTILRDVSISRKINRQFYSAVH